MNLSENPFFTNIERAPYELGHLLRKMPVDFSSHCALSAVDRNIAKAARDHASNANDTLMHGMEALGQLMMVAALNPENGIDASHSARLGSLITHMAVEAQFLQELDWGIQDVLAADDLRAAASKQAPSGKKGDAK